MLFAEYFTDSYSAKATAQDTKIKTSSKKKPGLRIDSEDLIASHQNPKKKPEVDSLTPAHPGSKGSGLYGITESMSERFPAAVDAEIINSSGRCSCRPRL
jgi:hypothetical protein